MRLAIAVIVFLAFLALSAKVVKNAPVTTDKGKIQVYFSADQFDAAGYVQNIWSDRILPYVKEKAVDFAALREALRKDPALAGEKYGYRAVAEQNPFNYAVKTRAKVISANIKSRNGRLEMDAEPFDGKPDFTLMVGPVYKGTSLRDLLDFVNFDDFKNQVEFAKLANELNSYSGDKVAVPLGVRQDGGVGKTFDLVGATTFEGNSDGMLVVPVSMEEVK